MEQSVIKGSLLTTHLSLSGISKELYLILKDSVARFEAAYEKMIQLVNGRSKEAKSYHAHPSYSLSR